MGILRTMPTLLQRLNDRFGDVAESVWPSLVKLDAGGGGGAGTIWHPDGLVITNAHVVQRGPLQVVLADGRRFPARLIAQDESLDVARPTVPTKPTYFAPRPFGPAVRRSRSDPRSKIQKRGGPKGPPNDPGPKGR